MSAFIKENAATFAVGAVVFGILAAIIIRLIANARKGKPSCACCDGCAGCK